MIPVALRGILHSTDIFKNVRCYNKHLKCHYVYKILQYIMGDMRVDDSRDSFLHPSKNYMQ